MERGREMREQERGERKSYDGGRELEGRGRLALLFPRPTRSRNARGTSLRVLRCRVVEYTSSDTHA